jgi:hypothetical protein
MLQRTKCQAVFAAVHHMFFVTLDFGMISGRVAGGRAAGRQGGRARGASAKKDKKKPPVTPAAQVKGGNAQGGL